jgi:hypothetical protein
VDFFGVEDTEVALVGTLCERARGEPFFGVLGLDHLVRPKPQLEGLGVESLFLEDGRNMLIVPCVGTFSVDTTRECVGVGLLSRDGVGVKELKELVEEDGGDSFLKGKGRRDRDLGFDQ